MQSNKWQKADEYTKECFNKWGYNPYQAVLTKSAKNPDGVYYDATILKHDDGGYIPCHGGVKLSKVHTMREARGILDKWIEDKTGAKS